LMVTDWVRSIMQTITMFRLSILRHCNSEIDIGPDNRTPLPDVHLNNRQDLYWSETNWNENTRQPRIAMRLIYRGFLHFKSSWR
jgi:hypothetical protein